MEKNAEISALRAYLREKVDELLQQQADARDRGDLTLFDRIGLQILEVEHRSRMLGRLEFAEATAKLAEKVAVVNEAREDLDAAIREIERFRDFLKTVAKFLGLVDKVIDFLA
ncbi:MAG: hypothetical protein ACK4TG_01410 [Thermaurantiacus sp.]